MIDTQFRSARLMVVDDDLATLKAVESILTNNGYIVSLAKSGKQAISFLNKGNTPELILLDISMPEMDGFETFKAIREIINVPIIFLTGLEDMKSELLGLELGAVDYITKPFVTDILLARIKTHINQARLFQSSEQLDESKSIVLNEEKLAKMKETLTESEYKIAKRIALGYTNQEIADELSFSYNYVKKVAYRVFDKLQISKRNEIRSFFV